jgi:drug/metabolite transporter (DMT)-like permease
MVLAMAAIIVIARARPEMPALAAGTISAIWAPLACLPFATMVGVTPGNVALMAAFGLVNSTLGFALFVYGSRRAAPVVTGLIGALETPLTPLWVWLIFAETPSSATLAGGAVVMLAVGWFIVVESRRPAPPPSPPHPPAHPS